MSAGGTVIFHNRRRQRRVSGKTRHRTLEMTECGHKPVCVCYMSAVSLCVSVYLCDCVFLFSGDGGFILTQGNF